MYQRLFSIRILTICRFYFELASYLTDNEEKRLSGIGIFGISYNSQTKNLVAVLQEFRFGHATWRKKGLAFREHTARLSLFFRVLLFSRSDKRRISSMIVDDRCGGIVVCCSTLSPLPIGPDLEVRGRQEHLIAKRYSFGRLSSDLLKGRRKSDDSE